MHDSDLRVISAVNNEAILESCLARSPDIVSGRLKLTTIRDASSMSEAYNRGLDQTSGKVALFAHQDVYLPKGWLDRAIKVLGDLDRQAPDWMVAGPYGVREDGHHIGLVWDGGLSCETGRPGFPPTPIGSLDELLLILRTDADFRFDPQLPHFHLYGTDLVQSCLAMGRSAWAVELPVVHNSQLVDSLGGGYTRAYRYVRRKWRDRLPIPTTICRVTYDPTELFWAKWRVSRNPKRQGKVTADAVEVARSLGYEAD